MKAFLRKIAPIAIASCMSISAFSNVFASEKINVMIGDNSLKFESTSPILEGNDVFLPLADLLKNEGYEVSYADETRTISAKKGTNEITFNISNNTLSVKNDSIFSLKPTIVSSAKIVDGRTMVSKDFIEKALNYSVEWDSKTSELKLTEKPAVENTFNLMNKYFEYSKKYSESTYAFKGTLNINLSATDGEKTIPIKSTGTIEGLTSQNKMNMSLAVKTDIDSLAKALEDESEGTDTTATVALLSSFKEIKIDYIADMNEGKIYFKSPLFATFLGSTGNSWIYIDFNDLFDQMGSDINFKSLLDISKATNFDEYLNKLDSLMPNTDESEKDKMTSTLTSLFADSSFVKKGNEYTSTFSSEEEGTTTNVTFTLIEKDDAIIGYKIGMNTGLDGADVMKMTAGMINDTSTATMNFSVPGILDMNFDMKMDYTKSSKTPVTTVPEGDEIIPFNSLLMNTMTSETDAEAEITE